LNGSSSSKDPARTTRYGRPLGAHWPSDDAGARTDVHVEDEPEGEGDVCGQDGGTLGLHLPSELGHLVGVPHRDLAAVTVLALVP
jgi:hypothetical protein